MPEVYQKWLDEDVVWIISQDERAKFMKLENDDERNEFIKQFWDRRDQEIPNGPRDAFRKEYYRRIAYANLHMAAGVAGWKTDRGRIYILYGPPDSVDSHPSSVGDVKPWEVWHYNAIQEYSPSVQEAQGDRALTVTKKDVDMRFVDTCSCGNFLLQTSPK
jgi:GWxTD domain-containing protein